MGYSCVSPYEGVIDMGYSCINTHMSLLLGYSCINTCELVIGCSCVSPYEGVIHSQPPLQVGLAGDACAGLTAGGL